jgi:hypothetical protein
VLVGVGVQVASGVPREATTSPAEAPVLFQVASTCPVEVDCRYEDAARGEPFNPAVTAALQEVYGLLDSRYFTKLFSTNQTMSLAEVVTKAPEIAFTVPACTVVAALHVGGEPLNERIFMSAAESM